MSRQRLGNGSILDYGDACGVLGVNVGGDSFSIQRRDTFKLIMVNENGDEFAAGGTIGGGALASA